VTILSKVLNEDFIIDVRPEMDKNDKWTGGVNISIMTSPDNPLDDDDYYGVLDFCRSVCASVPLMERDEDLRQRLIKEADYNEEKPQPKLKVVDKEDNVVVLSFESDNDNKKC
tara:strand:+ start:157 stop:495 length:339 start_codon:yes stop_codon:yes gene_type:complete